MQLLKETTEIDRSSRWSEIKKKIDSDSRYKAVDSSSRREDWFKDYIRTLEKVTINLFVSMAVMCLVSFIACHCLKGYYS